MIKKIQQAFFSESSVKGASIILIITLALSNVLGVFRDHFLAQKIPTDRLDIYFAAFRLPDLIFNILILSSIASAFIPIYSKYLKEKGTKEARELSQTAMTVATSLVVICLVVMYFLMPLLMRALVPSFNDLKRQETVELARFLLLSPLFFTLSYFLSGILNSHKHFLASSISPLLYNLSIILGVVLFADKIGVRGAAIGVVAGSFLHFAVQLPSALRLGFYPALKFNFRHSGVRQIIKLMIPRAIGLGANQILLVAYTVIASSFPGAIAIYSFADNIQTVPSVIFGISFAQAIFPTLASLSIYNCQEKERFEKLLVKSIRVSLFFLIPSTAAILLLRAQVIRLILGYGFFGWSDTKAASLTLGFFALSIIAQGLIPMFARGFYALCNTRLPMVSSLISIVVAIALGYFFANSSHQAISGVPGLALAYSIGSWINLVILAVYLSIEVKLELKKIISHALKVVLLTLFASLVVQITKDVIGAFFDIDRVRFLLLQAFSALALGAVVYFLGAWIFDLSGRNEK